MTGEESDAVSTTSNYSTFEIGDEIVNVEKTQLDRIWGKYWLEIIVLGIVLGILLIFIIFYFAAIRPSKLEKAALREYKVKEAATLFGDVSGITGLLINEKTTGLTVLNIDVEGEGSLDEVLVSGFLSAVAGIGSEITGKSCEGGLRHSSCLIHGGTQEGGQPDEVVGVD